MADQRQLARTTEPASWIAERVHPFALDVGSIVPPGFEAYARVLHPPYRVAQDGALRPVRWRDIAAANHRSVQDELRRLDVSCEPAQFSRQDEQLWDQQPSCGRLPHDIAERLVAILGRHTATPQSCWFAVWEGFADLRLPRDAASKLHLPHRSYLLLHGRVVDALETLSAADWIYLSPNLWWPEDGAWCVSTEIDFTWTYVGGTRACVQEILDHPDLEALATSPTEGNRLENE